MPFTLDDLRPNPGANKARKRVGRGHGSGHGKTAGRGTKGQKARSGRGVRPGFEGGQLPIQQRLPYKRGFTNIYRATWEVVNLQDLDRLDDQIASAPITPDVLHQVGIIRGTEFPVKVLGTGEVTRPLHLQVHAASEAAKSAIEAQGGTITLIERTARGVSARPRSRRLPLNAELKEAGVGKVGRPSRAEALRERNVPPTAVSPTIGLVTRGGNDDESSEPGAE
jgi:large subunit ribosomal protein L15